MKEYLQDCRSLQDLAIPTEDHYLLLNTKKLVQAVRVSKEVANYFKNKSNLKDYLKDYTILENSLYGSREISHDDNFTVIKYIDTDCPTCKGSGQYQISNLEFEPCYDCSGMGRVRTNEYYFLYVPEYRETVFNKYNIEPDFKVNQKLSGIYKEDGYWLKLFYDIPTANWKQIEEDMEKQDEI